jgi:putative flavoprotein involved in K+ transport
MESVETVVIGGGQAGLAMSYHLKEQCREHVVLERARVAERWRTQRWDSLMFQFPNWSIELPGCAYKGDDPDGFSQKDDVVRFIEAYSTRIEAPLRTGINVRSLRADAQPGRYIVLTDHGELQARNVVIATGPYQQPKIPPRSTGFPTDIVQLHASEYRNPNALPSGAVLVVGSGASGCQIADELVEAGRRVYLSVGRHRRFPRRYRGKDFFWWSRVLGRYDLTVDDSPQARRMAPPVVTGVHGGYSIDLRRSAANGLRLLGHLLDVSDGRVALAADLGENLRHGDQAFDNFRREVDGYISSTGTDVSQPLSDDNHAHATDAGESPRVIDVRVEAIRSIIWATGYTVDFGWVELPIFDEQGDPVHRRGVTAAPGIYFLGLAWLHKLTSSVLCGVGEDASFLAERIAEDRR